MAKLDNHVESSGILRLSEEAQNDGDVALKNLVGEGAEDVASKWADDGKLLKKLDVVRSCTGENESTVIDRLLGKGQDVHSSPGIRIVPVSPKSARDKGKALVRYQPPESDEDTDFGDSDDERGRTAHMLFAAQAGVDEKENRWWLSSPASQHADGNSSQEVLAQVYEEILTPVDGKDQDQIIGSSGGRVGLGKRKGALGRDGSWRVNMITPSTTPMRPRPVVAAKPVRVSPASPLATRSSAKGLPNLLSSTAGGGVDASLFLASPIQLSSSPIPENNASFMKELMGRNGDKGKTQVPSPTATRRSFEATSTRVDDMPHGEQETPARLSTRLPFPTVTPITTSTAVSKKLMKETSASTSSMAVSQLASKPPSSKRPRSTASSSKDLDKGPIPKRQRKNAPVADTLPGPSSQHKAASASHLASSVPTPLSKRDAGSGNGTMNHRPRQKEREKKKKGTSLRQAFTHEQILNIERRRLEWGAKWAQGTGEVAERMRAKRKQVIAKFGKSVLPEVGEGQRDHGRDSVDSVGGAAAVEDGARNSYISTTPLSKASAGTSPSPGSASTRGSPTKLAAVPTLPLSFELPGDDEGEGDVDWNRSRELMEAVKRDLKLGKKPTLPALLCTRSQESQE
ncbi:hypothetical protein EST38_g4065 [Candolleomyces aberdarensis]|uniref:Uncharacterized protein n=1 Tax=Candolleomyces aberdarensis TaxID=2316362 RepID=A0A4Q2DQT3_9AGAR|nr:hypothetical protein EST38_g4065 [Candolleomyces aberdarensis]